LGFAHLDIKTDNFVLNSDFAVSFIDFGQMECLDTKMRRLCGTPQFVAPEVQAASKNFEKYHYNAMMVDIYTLGRCLELIMKA
jgi:serine/threonine protein kinase